MITGLRELLQANDCADVEDLESQMCEETELDAHLELLERGVTLVIDRYWTASLLYPFTLEQFWSALSELDDVSIQEFDLAAEPAPDERAESVDRTELSEVGGTMSIDAGRRRPPVSGDV